MNSQKRNLLIGLAAVVALGGLYFAVNSRNKEKEDAALTDEKLVTHYPNLKVKELVITTPTGEASYVKQGTDWVVVGKENIGLVQLSVDQLIAYVKNLEYTSVVSENMKDAEQYGITKGNVITLKGEDGTEAQLTVGDMTVDQTGCYVSVPNGKKIFMINSEAGKALRKSPDDLRDRYPEYVNYDNSKYIKVEKPDGSSYIIEPNPNGALTQGYGEYIITGAYTHVMPIMTEALRDNIGAPLYNVYAETFIDEPEDLSVYGLDAPQVVISAEDNDGNTCSISVGKEADNGTVYAKFSNKDYVCTINGDNINKIKDAKLFDIVGKSLVTLNATDISEISVTGKDTEALFKLDSANNKVTYNGKEASSADFSEVYKQISVLTADGELSGAYGEEEAKITIIKTNGEAETLRFLAYDDNYYAVECNGQADFITGKKAVELVLYAISCVK